MEAPASAAAEAATSSDPKLIKIKVKTLGQASYDLEVESDAMIQDVKSQLAQASNISANLQRLVFRGRVLKDNQRLSTYNVEDASVIHLVTRPVDTSQQPAPASQRERLPTGGAGQFTANMMGAQGIGVPMDMNDFGSFIAAMLHTMGIQGAVHVTHTTVPSDTAGNATPEQMAQAVAEQISQQARQQSAEAGGEAPVPLLSALRTYMQRLDAMYQGGEAARFFSLPQAAAGGTALFNVHQFAAAAREFIGDWEGTDEVRDFIASSAEPSFAHWQPEAGTSAEAETPTAASAEQAHATEAGTTEGGGSTGEAPAQPTPAPASDAAARAAAAAAERDPRRNGLDNPFGDGRPEPMHPSLALLTEIAMQQLLRETARHMQAQAIPRIIQNRVDIQGPLPQQRLFSDEELQGLARTLHAEGTLLLETARAVSAYLLAQRSNSAAPLLNATAYHLRPDGSAPANTVPAALSSRRLTQERRNAIFINGAQDAGGATAAAGRGNAAAAGGRPPRQGTAGRREGVSNAGGRGNTTGGRGNADRGHAQQMPFVMPMQGFQVIRGMMNGSTQIPVGGHVVRINQQGNEHEPLLSMQIDDGEPVSLNLEPVIHALENVFTNVPGIEQLLGLGGRPATNASQTATPTQGTTNRGTARNASGTAASGRATAANTATSNPAAASATAGQQSGTAPDFAAMIPGLLQQAIPLVISMMAASGQAGATDGTGAAAGNTANPQGQFFPLPGFMTGANNEVVLDIQTILQGGTAAAQQAMGPILDGIMFSMNQAGFPMAPAPAPGGARAQTRGNPPQHPVNTGERRARAAQRAAAERSRDTRQRPGEHPLAADDDEDSDESDDGVPGLMQDSDQEVSLDGDSDGRDSQAELSDEDYDEGEDEDDDDDTGGQSEDESEDGASDDVPGLVPDGDSDVPGLVDDEDLSGEDDRSEGWQTAKEDSEDEAERRGGSDHGRRVRSRTESPSPEKDAAAKDASAAEATKDQAGKEEEEEQTKAASTAPSAPPAASSSIPVPAPGTRSGPQSWPLSADNFDDSVSPAGSPTPSAQPVGLPLLPPQASCPAVPMGTGLALPPRGGRGRGRGGRSTGAGRGPSLPPRTGPEPAKTSSTAAPQAPPAPSAPPSSADGAGVEEMQRPAAGRAGSPTGAPPDLGSLLGAIFGGNSGANGNAPRSAHGGGGSSGGGGGPIMELMQSPAMQQMTEEIFGMRPGARGPGDRASRTAPVAPSVSNGSPLMQMLQSPALNQIMSQQPGAGARGSGTPVSGALSAAPTGGGGLMDMVNQIAQSPAIERMANQMADQIEARGGGRGRGANARENPAPPDFGAFLQEMLPMMMGGAPQASRGGGAGRSSGAREGSSGDEFAALDALAPAEASCWREIIMADRRAQAEQAATALSSTYLAGSRSARSAE